MITARDCAILATASYARSATPGSADNGRHAVRMMTSAAPRWMTAWTHERGSFAVVLYWRDTRHSREYVLSYRGSDDWVDWVQNIGGFGLAKVNPTNMGPYISTFIRRATNALTPASLAWRYRERVQQACDGQARDARDTAAHLAREVRKATVNCHVATVGHSLGGGLAKLAAVELAAQLESNDKAKFVGCAAFNSPYIEDGYPQLQKATNKIVNINSRNDVISKYSRWKAVSDESKNTILLDTKIVSSDVDDQLSKSVDQMNEVNRNLILALSGGRKAVATEVARALRTHASAWTYLITQVAVLGPHSMIHLIDALAGPPFSTVSLDRIKAKHDDLDFDALRKK